MPSSGKTVSWARLPPAESARRKLCVFTLAPEATREPPETTTAARSAQWWLPVLLLLWYPLHTLPSRTKQLLAVRLSMPPPHLFSARTPFEESLQIILQMILFCRREDAVVHQT